MKFSEAQLEAAIIELLEEQGYSYIAGEEISRSNSEVLIKEDLQAYLATQSQTANITDSEIDSVIHQLETLPASDLYESNKTFCKWLSDGFLLKRDDHTKKRLNYY